MSFTLKKFFLHLRFGGLFGLKKRISMYEKISAFLSEKNNLTDSLVKIRNRYEVHKDFRAEILSDWLTKISKGERFSQAISEWVPSSELMLIEAGERGGSLDKGLAQAANMSLQASRTKSAIVSGIALPGFLFSLIITLLIIFQWQMAPIFKQLLPDLNKWPSSARSLDSLSSFFLHNIVFIVIFIIGLSILITKTLGKWTRYPRNIFDKIPPWSIYRGYQASSFLIALSSLLKAGVPTYDALEIIQNNSSPWMKLHIEKMMASMSLGTANPGRALNTGLLDDETAGDIEDYSDLGGFPETIQIIGNRTVENSVKLINDRMAVVKNILLVLVTVSIIWIYGASYNLQTSIADQQGKPPTQ